MTRGNQRELARQKQIKKEHASKKSVSAAEKEGNKGLTLEERRLRYLQHSLNCVLSRDAQALKAKQEAKAKASADKN
ncbi:hypothetical protein EG68_06536 [Paragonimus skrjabini miyazakii]|uniref:Small EDRK-rich factor-like N-terminal domain-containing protein n=1 Tax=Paragonimus skrjabini miyazakii TaxID=59628 RepID=A0A8S9YNH6_9TREM|nr:hypothetical protein EG68_06536 [Paragonimus skrjabini miyazakii]